MLMIWAVWAAWEEITMLAQKYTNYLPQRRYYVPQVSANCLACPKGDKYEQISDKQAVSCQTIGVNLNPYSFSCNRIKKHVITYTDYIIRSY